MTQAEYWLERAAFEARRATCQSARCGAVLVLGDRCVGMGSNGPAVGSRLRCNDTAPSTRRPKSDRTCCVHAEWRALLQSWPTTNTTLVFTRVDDTGQRVSSGLPYCTVCSRLALASGVRSWVLEHEGVVCEYDAETYDELSYAYDERLDVSELAAVMSSTIERFRVPADSWLSRPWTER